MSKKWKIKGSIGSKLMMALRRGKFIRINLVKYLEEKDVELFSDLSDNQLDIILWQNLDLIHQRLQFLQMKQNIIKNI